MPAIWTSRQPWVRRPSGLVVPNVSSPQWGLTDVWYPMQADGTVYDQKGAATTLALTGTTRRGATLGGLVPAFNGSSSYAQASGSDAFELRGAFTIAIWVRFTSNAQTNTYVLNRSNLFALLYEYVDNTVEFFSVGYTGTDPRTGSGITVADTEWHHLVYAYDGVTWAGYKDGRAAFSTTRVFALPDQTAAEALLVGTGTTGSNFCACEIADLRFRRSAWTPAQVWHAYAPRTRWELYQPIVRRVYFDLAGGGGGPTYTLTCDAGSYSLTGTDATLTVSRTLDCDPGSYAVTGTDAALTVGRTIAADPGSYTVTGTDAALTVGRTISADPGTYTLTGTDAALVVSRVLDAEAGAYTVTGTDADLTYTPIGGPTYTLTADAGSYTLTGTDATLTVSRTLACEAGVYTLTGADAGLVVGRVLDGAAGVYALTGTDVAFGRTYALAADSGVYTLTGTAATLTYSGAAPDLAADADTWRARPRPTAWRAKARPTAWKAKP